MPGQIVGKIPEFTADDTVGGGVRVIGGKEEVKETTPEEVVEEKETPAEPPAEIKPAPTEVVSDDTGELSKVSELERAVSGLQGERTKLLQEIVLLKGQRREIKQEELKKVETQLDELKDLAPEDVTIIDRVLRAKGYITKEEASRMSYEDAKKQELDRFLEKYPEYKPENDPSDVNWVRLQAELGYYRLPDDPRKIAEILERAHRQIGGKVSSDRGTAVKKQQLAMASVGSGGVQRSSSGKSLDPEKRSMLSRGGWSEEEIKDIEQNL